MKIITLGRVPFFKTNVTLYQTIDETPIDQWNMCHEYFIRHSDIGNNIQDVYKRYRTLSALILSKQNDKAMTELNNLYTTYWSAFNRINHRSLAFGVMIYAVDDKPIDDYSEEAVTELLLKLSKKGLTEKMVTSEIEDLKKKFSPNLN